MDAFVSHLSQILVGLERVVLFGHSFGGQIAMEWLCTVYTENVIGLIISNAPLDEVSYAAKQMQLRQKEVPEMQKFYEDDENDLLSNGTIESLVYSTMIGQGESRITGSMRDWTVKERIIPALARVPALFFSGDGDTIPYEEYEMLRVTAQVVIIPGTEHTPFYKSPDIFWGAINEFLKSISIESDN